MTTPTLNQPIPDILTLASRERFNRNIRIATTIAIFILVIFAGFGAYMYYHDKTTNNDRYYCNQCQDYVSRCSIDKFNINKVNFTDSLTNK